MEALGSVLAQVLERLEKVEAEGLDVTGLPTGLVDLDRKLGGLQPSTLVVVAGRPGMGKSALAMNIASHVAAHHGPVAYFSLEMSPTEIAYRWLGSEARVDSMKLRSGLGTTGDSSRIWSSLVEATSKLYKVPLHADEGSRTVTDVRAKCRRLKRKSGLAMVVVDYMQLMQGRSRENRQQEIAEISLNLKALARELDVPVIAVSQLNRALEARQDKRPQLGDLRESGAIEQDADVVLMIYPRRVLQQGHPRTRHRRDHHRQATGRPHRRGQDHLRRQVHPLRQPPPRLHQHPQSMTRCHLSGTDKRRTRTTPIPDC